MNLFKRIGKLNNLSMIALIAVYAFCLALIIIGCIPEKNYSVEYDYNHIPEYKEIDTSYYVRADYTYSKDAVTPSYMTRYQVSAHKGEDNLLETNLDIKKANFSTITVSKANYYYTERTSITTPASTTRQLQAKDRPLMMFFSFDYFNKDDEEKYLEYKEEFFQDPKNDRSFNGGNGIKFGDDEFVWQAINYKEDKADCISMHISTNTTSYYHLDLQTWIESEDGTIYPFVGIYGYYSSNGWIDMDEDVINELKAEKILVQFKVYQNGEEKEARYKIDIEDLQTYYDTFENSFDEFKQPFTVSPYVIIALIIVAVATVRYIIFYKSRKHK